MSQSKQKEARRKARLAAQRKALAAQSPTQTPSTRPERRSWLLAGSIAKIRRADAHLETLQEAIEDWIEQKPYDVIADSQGQGGKVVLRATERIPPPDSIATALGDYVHNLRTALDHLAWSCALRVSDRPVRQTAFPIFHDHATFEDKGWRYIEGMWSIDQARIERAQPYRHGQMKDPLYWVQQLDNADKHRLLLVVVSGAVMNGLGINELWGFDLHDMSVYGARPLEDGTPIADFVLIQTSANARVGMNPDFTYEVRFGNGVQCVAGLPVLPALNDMRSRVLDVMRAWRAD